MSPAPETHANLQAYSDLLAQCQQAGIEPEDAYKRLASNVIADVASLKDHEPLAAAVAMAASRHGLLDALLEASSNASDFVSGIVARYLCSASPEIAGAEQWLRAWWLKANTEEKAVLLKRLGSVMAHPEVSPWAETLFIEATHDADAYVVETAFSLLNSRLLGLPALGPSDRLIADVVLHLPAWLSISTPGARPLLEHRRIKESLKETPSVAVTLLETLSRPNDLTARETSAFVSTIAQLVCQAASTRDPENTALLLALTRSSLAANLLTSLLLQVALQTRGTDLTGFLPEEERPVFREWFTSSVRSTGLTNTINIYPTWIRTDPSGCLVCADGILAVFSERSNSKIPQVVAAATLAAAELWPDEFMPRLLEALQYHDDKIFLPVLASVARVRKGVIAPEMFQRLVGSKDAQYRVLATLSLESVALDLPQSPATAPQRPEIRFN